MMNDGPDQEDLGKIFDSFYVFAETAKTGVLDRRLILSITSLLKGYYDNVTENDLIEAWEICRSRLTNDSANFFDKKKNAKAEEIADLVILADAFRNLFWG
ncbi:MAG: hypothetical protein ACP5GH_01040 [Nitrososphaeria archaeon]